MIPEDYNIRLIVSKVNGVTGEQMIDGLNAVLQVFQEYRGNSASFLGYYNELFKGLKSCLLSESLDMDIVMKANQVIFEMLPEIQHN